MENSKNHFYFTVRVLFLVLFSCTSLSNVLAQDASGVKKWNFLTDVYVMFPYIFLLKK